MDRFSSPRSCFLNGLVTAAVVAGPEKPPGRNLVLVLLVLLMAAGELRLVLAKTPDQPLRGLEVVGLASFPA